MKIERLQGDYVLLRTDELRLLVPQFGILEIIHLQNRVLASDKCLGDAAQLSAFMVDDNAEDPNRTVAPKKVHTNTGVNDGAEDKLQFVALSDKLTLQSRIPSDRFVITKHANMPDLRWCWSEVHLFNNANLVASPLPPLLRTDITPLQSVITLSDDVQAFYCDFKHLLRYLMHR